MKVSEAVTSRHSVRAFQDRPVDRTIIEKLLEKARWAPSGGNLQPWRVYVVGGEDLARFKADMNDRIASQPMGEACEYAVYPPRLKEPYRTHRFECGEALYNAIGVERGDAFGRLAQFANNYQFFGAPVALFFAIDRSMRQGQWADLGMFVQTFMLLAREEGLHTCAQEAWSVWPKTVAEFLDMPEELMLFCGMALGYKDEEHAINNWRTERAPLEQFVHWRGFDSD